MSPTVAYTSCHGFLCSFFSSIRRKVTKTRRHPQVFARRICVVGRNSQTTFYTYSIKRSRTRTRRASAISCRRLSAGSERPFTMLLIVCRLTPIRSASSPSLTFFPTSLCAGSTATQTSFLFSLLSLFCWLIHKQRPPRCSSQEGARIGLGGQGRPTIISSLQSFSCHVYRCPFGESSPRDLAGRTTFHFSLPRASLP